MPFFACSGEVLGSGRTDLADAAQHRLRLPVEAGRLVRIRYRDAGSPGEVELVRCAATALPDPDDRWRVYESPAPDIWLETNGAEYALQSPGHWTSTSPRPASPKAAAPATFLLRRDGRTLFFPLQLDRSRPVEVAVNALDLVADARWCTGCAEAEISDCKDVRPAQSLTIQTDLDDGVRVVATRDEAGKSGRLTLRLRRARRIVPKGGSSPLCGNDKGRINRTSA